jgi:hypothetical protein
MPDNSTNEPILGRTQAPPPAIIRPSSDQTPKALAPTTLVPGTKPIKFQPKVFKGGKLALGLGKLTSTINTGINKVRTAINGFYYGKSTVSGANRPINPLDYGLINLLQLLASVDVCNLITYALNQIPGAKQFDPNDKSGTDTPLGNIKYQIQFSAYTIQSIIDEYYGQFSDAQSEISKTKLGQIVVEIKQALEVLLSPESQQALNSDVMKQAFPSVTLFSNYLSNSLAAFDKYSDVRNLPQEDLQKLIEYIDKTRETCMAIQSLNSPTNVIAFADSFLGADLAAQLKELDKIIKPEKIVPTVKKITETCRKIQDACNKILQFVGIGRLVISIAILLILILKIISKFLKALPIPNLFTVLGLSTAMSEANGKLVSTAEYFTNRLSEINSVLNNLYSLVQDIIIKIENIIQVINLIIANLESCNNVDPQLVQELKDSREVLNLTVAELKDFVDTYDQNKKKRNDSIGDYTIQIQTEQLVDEGIELKRRFGIALDKNQIIVVQSTPTFASDDNIIIEEVKFLLRSKNLIKPQNVDATINELAIINESNNYLKEEISLDTIDENVNFNLDDDDTENEDEDAGDTLNLNAFVNKLKGGRRLRVRMRRQMAKQRRQLSDSLAKSDPNSRASSSTVKNQKKKAFEDEIGALKEQIKIWKEDKTALQVLLISPLIPVQVAARAKIKDLDKKISDSDKRIKYLQEQLKLI